MIWQTISMKYKRKYIFTCQEALDKSLLKNISSIDEIASKCLDICKETMGKESLKDTVTKRNRVNIIKDYPQNSRLLILKGEIIGFWFFVSLKKEQFELAKKGKLCEKTITKNNIINLNDEPIGEYRGYFVDIAISQKYQKIEKSKYFKLLLKSFIEQIEKYAKKEEIFFTEWCAVASTKQGEKFCEHFGLVKINCEYCIPSESVYYAKYEDIRIHLNKSLGKLKMLGVEKIYLKLTAQYEKYFGRKISCETSSEKSNRDTNWTKIGVIVAIVVGVITLIGVIWNICKE